MPADGPFELQGSQPADHLSHRELDLPGEFRRVHGHGLGEVDEQTIPRPGGFETDARGRLQRVVQHLELNTQGGQHVPRVLDKARTVADEPMSAH